MPNSAIQLQMADLTTATNSPEKIKMKSATNIPEHTHLACGKIYRRELKYFLQKIHRNKFN